MYVRTSCLPACMSVNETNSFPSDCRGSNRGSRYSTQDGERMSPESHLAALSHTGTKPVMPHTPHVSSYPTYASSFSSYISFCNITRPPRPPRPVATPSGGECGNSTHSSASLGGLIYWHVHTGASLFPSIVPFYLYLSIWTHRSPRFTFR